MSLSLTLIVRHNVSYKTGEYFHCTTTYCTIHRSKLYTVFETFLTYPNGVDPIGLINVKFQLGWPVGVS